MLPVELIDDNGIMLKKCVMQLIELWGLGDEFKKWVDEACVFTSTLVDRIITGYPRATEKEEWEKLGYEDHIMVTGEPFALWVIESAKDISKEFPLPDAGLPVIFTDNQKPYKQRKVRILNGAHTSFVLASYLCGNDIVRQSMQDDDIRNFMLKTIYDEVIPTLSLPEEELKQFAGEVVNRFNNPYVDHALLAISLNSVSKWRARCMPSFLGYIEKEGKLPSDAYAVKSVVSANLAEKIADAHGVKFYNVLTGFKFIGEVIKEHLAAGHGTFLLGFEESYGYLKGTYARDKDAVVASMLICEMAAFYKAKNMTLIDALDELFERYGYFGERVKNIQITGLDAAGQMAKIMKGLRENSPASLCGVKVAETRDYLDSTVRRSDGSVGETGLPKTNMLYYVLENGDVYIVRPSGTEPKIKVYILSQAKTREALGAQLDALDREADAMFSKQ